MWGASFQPTAIESCQSIVDQLLSLGALTDTLQQTLGLTNGLLPAVPILGPGPGPGQDGGNGLLLSAGKPKEKSKAKANGGGGLFGGLLRN